jgi:acid phosphatase
MLFSRPFLSLAAACTAAVLFAAATQGDDGPELVPGKVFDRFVIVWLENTDFDAAKADRPLLFSLSRPHAHATPPTASLSALATQGIELDNYFAVAHPSEPNYIASVGGEYFGMNNDAITRVPANISTVVDLLEAKGITWAEYQEDLPFTGFPGDFANPVTGATDYVRKHK